MRGWSHPTSSQQFPSLHLVEVLSTPEPPSKSALSRHEVCNFCKCGASVSLSSACRDGTVPERCDGGGTVSERWCPDSLGVKNFRTVRHALKQWVLDLLGVLVPPALMGVVITSGCGSPSSKGKLMADDLPSPAKVQVVTFGRGEIPRT